jgi:hypothetical protein
VIVAARDRYFVLDSWRKRSTTPYLTDFGWVFLRHFDFPELADGSGPGEETRAIAERCAHERWLGGRKVHGWTVLPKAPLS